MRWLEGLVRFVVILWALSVLVLVADQLAGVLGAYLSLGLVVALWATWLARGRGLRLGSRGR